MVGMRIEQVGGRVICDGFLRRACLKRMPIHPRPCSSPWNGVSPRCFANAKKDLLAPSFFP